MLKNRSRNIIDEFASLLNSDSEEESIKRESYILMANYLSEIERLYKDDGLNRKDLSLKIGTSASYLTQVFRGDKPLNFLTLAKIKRALNLKFDVTAEFKTEMKANIYPKMEVNYFASPDEPVYEQKISKYDWMATTIERNHVILIDELKIAL